MLGGDRAATVSVGWAYAHDPWDVAGLEQEADASLYRSKAMRSRRVAPAGGPGTRR
jgi:hypothetical protein